VPARDPQRRWLAPVQDAQRAVSLVRASAAAWASTRAHRHPRLQRRRHHRRLHLAPPRNRRHPALDATDKLSCRPDFTLSIDTGGFVERLPAATTDTIAFSKDAPPMFLVHAFDDNVSVQDSLHVATELKTGGLRRAPRLRHRRPRLRPALRRRTTRSPLGPPAPPNGSPAAACSAGLRIRISVRSRRRTGTTPAKPAERWPSLRRRIQHP